MKVIINKIEDCRRCPNFGRESKINGIGRNINGYCKLEDGYNYFEPSEEEWNIKPNCSLEDYIPDRKIKEYD